MSDLVEHDLFRPTSWHVIGSCSNRSWIFDRGILGWDSYCSVSGSAERRCFNLRCRPLRTRDLAVEIFAENHQLKGSRHSRHLDFIYRAKVSWTMLPGCHDALLIPCVSWAYADRQHSFWKLRMPRAAESPWQIEKWQSQQNLKISSEMKILESYDILNIYIYIWTMQCDMIW